MSASSQKDKRRIPCTMATQHPDNASDAFWCGKSFINTADEIEEAHVAFQNLGCDEYMWDWEGKFVDEAVIDKLFRNYTQYFRKHPLGKEKFLTYRIPNVWEEKGYRLARAFINIVTSADLADEFKFHSPPVLEVILPMTKTAEQVMQTEKMFRKVAQLKCEIFEHKKKCRFDRISVIPLSERVEDLTSVDALLGKYLAMYKKAYGEYPPYVRPFIARSDPALNAGLVPAVLASKVAISHYYRLAEKYGVPMYPIIGTGSLPFRGGVNPENIAEVIPEYQGIRTISIQSAFRYDYPQAQVRKALRFITKTLPKLKPAMLSAREISDVININRVFSTLYRATVEPLASFINTIAKYIPSRRERMLHIGLFGYSRGMGKVSLPRAITFTAVFYSLGIPPEFIGTGRGLRAIQKAGQLPFAQRLYVNLKRDLVHAGKFLNKENLTFLAKRMPEFQKIAEDVREVENILGVELGPMKDHHFLHRNAVSSIYHKLQMREDPSDDVLRAAKIRKSLG